MQTFDILFYSGKGLVSRFVQNVTKSPYSHVALVISERLVVETNWSFPVSIRPNEYEPKEYAICRVELTKEQADKIYEYIEKTLGSKYDLGQVIYHILHARFGTKIVNNPKLFTCSEWVDKAFKYAGVDLIPCEVDGSVTPADLFNSSRINLVKAVDQ